MIIRSASLKRQSFQRGSVESPTSSRRALFEFAKRQALQATVGNQGSYRQNHRLRNPLPLPELQHLRRQGWARFDKAADPEVVERIRRAIDERVLDPGRSVFGG